MNAGIKFKILSSIIKYKMERWEIEIRKYNAINLYLPNECTIIILKYCQPCLWDNEFGKFISINYPELQLNQLDDFLKLHDVVIFKCFDDFLKCKRYAINNDKYELILIDVLTALGNTVSSFRLSSVGKESYYRFEWYNNTSINLDKCDSLILCGACEIVCIKVSKDEQQKIKQFLNNQ